jgi:hypothetical protein
VKLSGDTRDKLLQQEKTLVSQLIAGRKFSENLLKDHFALYLGPPCLALCEQIRRKLPRELRDIIYEYLLYTGIEIFDADRIFKMFNDEGQPNPDHIEYEIGIFPGIRILSVGHLADTNYVGSTMRIELAEAYYCGTIFSFEAFVPSKAYQCLENTLFRPMDPWYIGAELSGLVKNVEMLVVDDCLMDPDHPQDLNEFTHLLRIEAAIRFSIRVKIYWSGEHTTDANLAIATSKLFPLVDELRAKGYTVTIEIVKRLDNWYIHKEKVQHKLAGKDVTAKELELALRNVKV